MMMSTMFFFSLSRLTGADDPCRDCSTRVHFEKALCPMSSVYEPTTMSWTVSYSSRCSRTPRRYFIMLAGGPSSRWRKFLGVSTKIPVKVFGGCPHSSPRRVSKSPLLLSCEVSAPHSTILL
eukprot:TRINITY_DN31963_c0_g1_i1.p1 TRINITY_DN31963_c0_g1~~TRINITY_DN31963_c0_g1_i1.p1  ORF type:complete len:122 (-),score=8.54 TRINITY_DN31963_c0_g1_i1:11-376(-)